LASSRFQKGDRGLRRCVDVTAQQTVITEGSKVAGLGVIAFGRRAGNASESVNPWPTLGSSSFAISSRFEPEPTRQSETASYNAPTSSGSNPNPFAFLRRFGLSAIGRLAPLRRSMFVRRETETFASGQLLGGL